MPRMLTLSRHSVVKEYSCNFKQNTVGAGPRSYVLRLSPAKQPRTNDETITGRNLTTNNSRAVMRVEVTN